MKTFACVLAFYALMVVPLVGFPPQAAHGQQAVDVSTHPWIGKPAPSFALKKVGGGELTLESLRGKIVVIHFGTSW